jgi:xanthine dehydrogenase accessory factor
MTHDSIEHVRTIQKLLDAEISFVTITLVDVRGSAPQIIGAKAIVTESGLEAGTVGGGKIENASIKHAQAMLAQVEKTTEFVVWNLQTEIGMTCGGEVKLFFEMEKRTAWPIAVYGAGHVAQALIRQLILLNCQVQCIDPRSDWLEKLPDHPKLKKSCVANPAETVGLQPSNTFFVLMSRGHATDLPVLAEILKTRNAPYVGVIGSNQKASVLRRELKSIGVASDKIESFFCPIGLPLGNNTPAEIAISVVSQLIMKRDEIVQAK